MKQKNLSRNQKKLHAEELASNELLSILGGTNGVDLTNSSDGAPSDEPPSQGVLGLAICCNA